MPIKKSNQLTARTVQTLKKPGYYGDGGNLYLRVTATGRKSWAFLFRFSKKDHEYGLGPYPDVSLAQAREDAATQRKAIRAGVNPVFARASAKASKNLLNAMGFDECAKLYIKAHEKGWKNVKHAAQWMSTIKTYASPTLGKMQARDIKVAHILKVLEPIWHTKTETASRLRSRMEKVLDWAKVAGYREGDNPARWKGNLDALLPSPNTISEVRHHPAVPIKLVGAFVRELRRIDGTVARMLEFAVLTAARSIEVRGAVWSEFDFADAVWTVPKERMKAGKEHKVPLSSAALTLLANLPKTSGCELCFPAAQLGWLSDAVMTDLMGRMIVEGKPVHAVPHGCRSTFRDWASECTNYPREVAEKALAHTIGDKVEAAYRRGELMAKRRSMMEDWAKFVERVEVDSSNIVGIGAATANA